VDAELEVDRFDKKIKVKFFNMIWHPYLPQKVSAIQWFVLNEGHQVGA
jgi:hypothetical protein